MIQPPQAVTKHGKPGNGLTGRKGRSHPSYSAPPSPSGREHQDTVCLWGGYLGSQARQDVRQEVPFTQILLRGMVKTHHLILPDVGFTP